MRGSNEKRLKRDYQLEERKTLEPLRTLADQAFSRAAGAPLIDGNKVRLLINAAENKQHDAALKLLLSEIILSRTEAIH